MTHRVTTHTTTGRIETRLVQDADADVILRSAEEQGATIPVAGNGDAYITYRGSQHTTVEAAYAPEYW